VLNRLDGGTLPTATSALQTLSNRFDMSQCVAAKSLAIHVNPQYGALDYRAIAVVAAPNKLSALPGKPSPSPTGTAAPQLTPHC
jgi:hypothetical protein